jgi:hypothetical protein
VPECYVIRALPVLYVILLVGWNYIYVKLGAPTLIFVWIQVCNIFGVMSGRVKPKFSEKGLSQCESVQMNVERNALGSNQALRGDRANRLDL